MNVYFSHFTLIKNILNPLFYYLQTKPGVISAVGGLTLGKPGLQIQVLNSGISQMPTLQPSAPVQTQVRVVYTYCFL